MQVRMESLNSKMQPQLPLNSPSSSPMDCQALSFTGKHANTQTASHTPESHSPKSFSSQTSQIHHQPQSNSQHQSQHTKHSSSSQFNQSNGQEDEKEKREVGEKGKEDEMGKDCQQVIMNSSQRPIRQATTISLDNNNNHRKSIIIAHSSGSPMDGNGSTSQQQTERLASAINGDERKNAKESETKGTTIEVRKQTEDGRECEHKQVNQKCNKNLLQSLSQKDQQVSASGQESTLPQNSAPESGPKRDAPESTVLNSQSSQNSVTTKTIERSVSQTLITKGTKESVEKSDSDRISSSVPSIKNAISTLTIYRNSFDRLFTPLKRLKMGVVSACMPCVPKNGNKENAEENAKVESQLSEWKKQEDEVTKLLLIGAGESGKTTIIKQMKIIHINGFTDAEKHDKRREIRENIFEAIKELTGNMEYLKPPIGLGSEENRPSLEFIKALDMLLKESYDFPQVFYDHIKNLWADTGVRECYRRANEFGLIDSAKYFLDKIEEVRKDDYIPSNQDILQSRRRTREIQKIEFQKKIPIQYGGGHQHFWMFDVGGQKGERRKWIQVFAGIQAILFVVDCSSYDTNLREDDTKNRLRESLELFEDIWFSRYLAKTGFILFLNKQDVLKEKLLAGTTKIADYFPEYADYKPSKEPANEFERVRAFIKEKFVAITKQKVSRNGQSIHDIDRSKVFTHFTTATDTNNVTHVFNDVHTMLILEALGI